MVYLITNPTSLMNFSTEIGSSDGNTSEKVPFCSDEIQFEYSTESKWIKFELSELTFTLKWMNLQKLNFPFLLLIKNEQRASGILSCGIYYDDLIQVKSLCDDQVCMILI